MTNYKDFTIVSGRGGLATQEDVFLQHKLITEIGLKLDALVEKKALPEDTQDMIPELLSHFKFQPECREQFQHRLVHGLYQAFLYHSKEIDNLRQIEFDDLEP